MFPSRLFPNDYFARRYWPKVGAVGGEAIRTSAYVRITATRAARRIVVPPDPRRIKP